jgi:hypothetical protein
MDRECYSRLSLKHIVDSTSDSTPGTCDRECEDVYGYTRYMECVTWVEEFVIKHITCVLDEFIGLVDSLVCRTMRSNGDATTIVCITIRDFDIGDVLVRKNGTNGTIADNFCLGIIGEYNLE